MNLQIRDPRARVLAHKIATARQVSMTEAVVAALEKEVERVEVREPFLVVARQIAAELKAMGKPGGRDLTKAERDAMWGHDD